MTELKVMQMETDEKALCEQEGNEVCDTEDIGFLKRAVKLDLQKFDTLRDLAFCLPELQDFVSNIKVGQKLVLDISKETMRKL